MGYPKLQIRSNRRTVMSLQLVPVLWVEGMLEDMIRDLGVTGRFWYGKRSAD